MPSIADPTWAIESLERFLALSASTFGVGAVWRYDSGATEAQIEAEAQVAEQIIWAILPQWEFEEEASYEEPWNSHRKGAIRAIAQLRNQDTLASKLGTPAPKLDASFLHPWVWESAKVPWSAGSFSDAVRAAARAINAKARQKLNRRDASEWKLIQNAFSLKPPVEGEPRLRLMNDPNDETFKSIHGGAGALAQGLFMAVRNPANHEDDTIEVQEHIALEQLAAFSVLARFIDEASVETV